VKRRHKPEDVQLRPNGDNGGYFVAFEDGSMRGLQFPTFGDPDPYAHEYSMPELRKAWSEYRQSFLDDQKSRGEYWGIDFGKSWAELVFDEGMDSDEARADVERRRASISTCNFCHLRLPLESNPMRHRCTAACMSAVL
jgi:hypothetical protein